MNIKDEKHDGEILVTLNKHDVIKCDKCGYAHVMPLPTSEYINEFYGKDYYETIKPEMLSYYEKSLDWFNQMYDDRFEIFEENTTMPGKVLDIGAGAGYFLKRAKERNWEYVGVEASRAACKYAEEYNKINIINDFIENVSVSDVGQFDAINISEVLEHVVNPVDILKNCYKLLKDDGILFIMVPNEFNPLQLAHNEINPDSSNFWVVPDHHYNYFNFNSINNVLEKARFKSFKTEASFPIEFSLLAGVNYVEDREKGKISHGYVKQLELNLVNNGFRSLKRELYENMAKIGFGRDIMIYSKKVMD